MWGEGYKRTNETKLKEKIRYDHGIMVTENRVTRI